MSQAKKQRRQQFRDGVLAAAKNRCSVCFHGEDLDPHHITPREKLPEEERYDPKHGICLCQLCHIRAEAVLNHPTLAKEWPGYTPAVLKRLRAAQEQ